MLRNGRARLARTCAVCRPLLLLLVLVTCGDRPPQPPQDDPGGGDDHFRVRGDEYLSWSHEAPRTEDLVLYSYAAYIDGQRRALDGTSCSPRGVAVHSCVAPLPPLSRGRHTIEIVALIASGGQVLESSRSAPIFVTPVGSPTAGASTARHVKVGHERYSVEVVAGGLTGPVALAFPPDGRIFVAERDGTVRVVQSGSQAHGTALFAEHLREDGQVIVHDLILHPDYQDNRVVLLLYSVVDRTGAVTRLVRYREVDDALTEPTILIARTASSAVEPSAAVAFGHDRMLYVAMSDEESVLRGPGPIGTLVRLNDDGSTPADMSDFSEPAAALGQPVSIGQNPLTRRFWLVGRSPSAAREWDRRFDWVLRRNATSATLYSGSSFPAFRSSLFVASPDRDYLEHLRFDSASRRWISGAVLLPRWLGRVRTVNQGYAGLLYVGTDNCVPPHLTGRDVVARIVPVSRRKTSPRE
jgi:glucose/arabinose dehydrogenase